MSGGSYDYLSFNLADLSSQRHQLERMAQRLESLTYATAAADQTRRVLRLLDAAEELAYSLEKVWHDVEWWDSADYSEATVVKTCENYRPPALAVPYGDARPPDPAVLYRLVDVGRGRYELRPTIDTGRSDQEGAHR